MTRTVLVRAPSRLHFGLMSFDRADAPQFGGVGVMICEPELKLRVKSANKFETKGLLAERIMEFARSATDHWQLAGLPPCSLEMMSTPAAHHGLGSGTQLALSVAAGLREFLGMSPADERELAASVGRGRRSSVGVYGFCRGGLIVDAGHAKDEPLGRLETQLPMPDAWRFVLVRAPGPPGRSGTEERRAFADLPPIPQHVTDRLFSLATEHLVPSATSAAFSDFSEHLYEYGRLAGECFAVCQGGPFASPTIAQLVEALRNRGIRGVGQSSWGPTVFALTEDATQAAEIEEQIRHDLSGIDGCVTVTAPCNSGATVRVSE